MPRLCHARNASRWERVIELQYDDELADPNSVFARNDLDMEWPGNRLDTAFGFVGDPGRIDHCRKLAELLILAHYRNEHGEVEWENRINEIAASARASEADYPEIAAEMSVDQAVALGGWNA